MRGGRAGSAWEAVGELHNGRRLCHTTVWVAIVLEERGLRAVPTLDCLPLGTRGPFTIADYVNQIRIGEATRIVVAHRLSTIRNADRIYYLESDKIAGHPCVSAPLR